MKKKLITLSVMFGCLFTYGQAIKKVKTVLFENKYGNARLLVEPTVFDMHAPAPTKTSGVYAIRVCYTYKGQQKALHQDLTYDFIKKGSKEIFLGMSAKKSNISIGNVLFYRRDLTPPKKQPKKSDCF